MTIFEINNCSYPIIRHT